MNLRNWLSIILLINVSYAWTVTSVTRWNQLFRQTEDIVSEGADLSQADRTIKELKKSAAKFGGPVYVKRVEWLGKSLEAQKSLQRGDLSHAQKLIKMSGYYILPAVRLAVKQAQEKERIGRYQPATRIPHQSMVQEEPVMYKEPAPIVQKAIEQKQEGKQQAPGEQLPIQSTQQLATLEESHAREIMRAQRRQEIDQLVETVCAEDVNVVKELLEPFEVGQEEPDLSVIDDVLSDLAQVHQLLQSTRTEYPELASFIDKKTAESQACEVPIKDGLRKMPKKMIKKQVRFKEEPEVIIIPSSTEREEVPGK